ncbi:magnesium ion transmembrane transporter [Musa troglodytarum]|uniref:Magnesium transporter n=1 Tax=Musa troglodytarum TaxID=320322 RepID=A0A9E7GWR4_9LILI|nr:magnesium ion transmembrane transporter [Musa troglodytarum]
MEFPTRSRNVVFAVAGAQKESMGRSEAENINPAEEESREGMDLLSHARPRNLQSREEEVEAESRRVQDGFFFPFSCVLLTSMAVAASSSSSSSSLIILFLDLPRLLRQNHRSASQSPLLCPPAKNPSRSARRTKLLVPAAAFSPLLPSLRRKLTPPPSRSLADDRSGDDGAAVVEYVADVVDNGSIRAVGIGARPGSPRPQRNAGSADSISLGIKEPVYEVIEVKSDGTMYMKKINRRQLLKSSGLRPRDIRSVDPSLWLMNSMPSLLVREQAILLNLGTLRAIAMHECVLIFDYNCKGGKAFLKSLLPRLNPRNMNVGCAMPFALEVVEAALLSRIQRLEQKLMEVEPRVASLLEVLPNRLTADVLEQLRLSKQTLVELGSKAGAVKQMLLDLLEDPHEIRRICIMGRNCTVRHGTNYMECSIPLDKQIAQEEEEEIEMLLENYLQRCESCHGQAERLLDSAKEMEDSIAVNLSSRRLEVSRVELFLQVGAFCVSVAETHVTGLCMEAEEFMCRDLECIYTVTCSLVTRANSSDEALEIAKLISAKFVQQPTDRPVLQLKIMAKDSFAFLTSFSTFNECKNEAKEEPVRAVIDFVKLPDIFQHNVANGISTTQTNNPPKGLQGMQGLAVRTVL